MGCLVMMVFVFDERKNDLFGEMLRDRIGWV